MPTSKWGVEITPFGERSESYKAATVQAYTQLREVFKADFGLDLFVCYGTLLGLERHGDFIAHDDDLDAAYVSKASEPEEVLRECVKIVRALASLGWTVDMESFGQFRLRRKVAGESVYVEVFTAWYDASERLFLYFAVTGVADLDIRALKTMRLHHEDVLVPVATPELLAAIYGVNWRQPDPDFKYDLQWETWKNFEFLFQRRNKTYWDEYYAKADGIWSTVPTQFCVSVAQEALVGRTPRAHILEIGCGNGRDAIAMLRMGARVHAVDYSESAVEYCKSKTQAESEITFDTFNVYDVFEVDQFRKDRVGQFDVVYARFFLHAISLFGEENFWNTARDVLAPGGVVAVEFRTTEDQLSAKGDELGRNERRHGHYRRFLHAGEVIRRAERVGFRIVYVGEGQGMARFGAEDPHVCRIFAQLAES